MASHPLRRFAILSLLAAVTTIGMKTSAYLLTGSIGLFSDALESGVNFLAAATAYFSLWYASQPVDENHTFGHEKIEYFASGLEGIFIAIAGVGTVIYAVDRVLNPQPLKQLEIGTLIAGVAALVNLAVARVLLRVGKREKSIVLESDGHHLMTDVYTSLAVIVGLVFVKLTGLTYLDPILGIVVGVNILWTAYELLRRSFNGLMDHAIPAEEQAKLRDTIRAALPPNTDFHALRTRQAGMKTFAEFHLLVPGKMSVREAHELVHQVEDRLKDTTPGLIATIHMEPIEEPASWEVAELRQLGELPVQKDG